MSSAISTYNGPRSAKERAAIAWGADHGDRLHEQEQQRHERLIAATRRIPEKAKPSRTSRFQQGDRYHWRRKARAAGVIKGTCPKCLGKGWILWNKYGDYDDFRDCPECTPVREYSGPYPTADDDVMDIPF